MERGTVVAVNPRNLRIVVAVDGDHCAVFELGSPAAVHEGHRLRGKLESDLCFVLENLSTGEMLDVVPVSQHTDRDAALRTAGL